MPAPKIIDELNPPSKAGGLGPAAQSMGQFAIEFMLPDSVDPALLDPWLALLGLPAEQVEFEVPQEDMCSELATKWLWRLLRVGCRLLQAARVPAFAPPKVVSVVPSVRTPRHWRGMVRIPHFRPLQYGIHERALAGAAQLCQWAVGRAPDATAVAAFFEMLDQRVLPGLAPIAPGAQSTIHVLRGAYDLGVPFMHLGGGIYQLGWGSRARRLDGSMTGVDSAIGARIARDKAHTAQLLRLAGLPVPNHTLVSQWEEARVAAQQLGWPLVLRPADRDRGLGVTVDVADDSVLRAAFERAHGNSRQRRVLVERQMAGWCHRVFVAHGEMLYAVKRLPLSIQGDGHRSIERIVDDEVRAEQRKPPWSRSGIQPLDSLAQQSISRAGFSASSVPAAGESVPLRRIESTELGGTDEDVTHAIHPDNVAIAVKAAALLGLQVAGIDIITEDISRPWHKTGSVINEVNHSPLLGDGDISRRRIPEFILRLMGESRGRIPVVTFVGGPGARKAARVRWQKLCATGLRCWITDGTSTLDPDGTAVQVPFRTAVQRTNALVLDDAVDAIVVAMDEGEFRSDGAALAGTAVFRVRPVEPSEAA